MICEKCNKKCKEVFPAIGLAYCPECKAMFYVGDIEKPL